MKNIFSKKKKMWIIESLKMASLGGLENSFFPMGFQPWAAVNGSIHERHLSADDHRRMGVLGGKNEYHFHKTTGF